MSMKNTTQKTAFHSNGNAFNPTPFRHKTRAELLADFDELMLRAARGDAYAIGAIAIVFSPKLLQEARAELGDFAHDAGDVLNDFFTSLLEGRSRFAPDRRRAMPWMVGVVRAMARKHRIDRERDWGIDEGGP
jgi:hypothetical protein